MDAVGPILQHVLHAGLDYPSPFEVLANPLNIMQDRITRTRLAGDPPDVLLCPRLGAFSWLDFHRANEARRRISMRAGCGADDTASMPERDNRFVMYLLEK
jgi:predicted acylesterase/phospholipase RssA